MVAVTGRAPTGQALVASDEAPAGLHPSGFDPSRIVGRVAQVLWDQRCPGIRLDPEDVQFYEDHAREVIAAMSDPDPEMLQPACEKHLPGKPMHDTTRPWPDERYRTEEECHRFVARRRIWKSMIAQASAMSAGTAETPQEAQGEARQRGGEAETPK